MLHEFDDDNTKNNGMKLKHIIHELCVSDCNLDDFYLANNLYVKSTGRLTATGWITRHCINWLYTVRCECGCGGINFINICLKAIKETMHRDIDDMQYAFTKIIFDILIEQRNLYK